MFRVAPVCLVSAYSLFMIEQKNNKALKGLPIGDRGRMTAKLYHSLSPKDRKSLQRRAEKVPAFARQPPSRPRRPSKYQVFTKVHYDHRALRGLPFGQRMQVLGEWWQQYKASQVKGAPAWKPPRSVTPPPKGARRAKAKKVGQKVIKKKKRPTQRKPKAVKKSKSFTRAKVRIASKTKTMKKTPKRKSTAKTPKKAAKGKKSTVRSKGSTRRKR